MQKVTFNGTILDFLSFLKAYIRRRQTPGLRSFSPQFSVKEPDIESITDSTRFANFQIYPSTHGLTAERLEVLASRLPDKATLLTATVKPSELFDKLYGPVQVERLRSDFGLGKPESEKLWAAIVSELAEQGWLLENANAEQGENDLRQLRQLLQNRLSLSDVRDLCFELEINFENLGESTLNGAVRELIIRMQQRGQVDDLLRACKQIRPDLDL